MTIQLSPAQQYLTTVAQHSDPEIAAAYKMIPKVFIDQIFGDASGVAYNQCFLNGGLVSDTNYNNMSTVNTDFFRVELVDGNVTANGDPAFKVRITGKMDNTTKEMVPMVKGALPDPTSSWLKNFKSDIYVITKEDVAADKISAADYQTILEYCKVWKGVEAAGGNMYTAEHKGNRYSFIARNTAFLFVFDIQVRPNYSKNRKATDPLWTPGITNVSWSNVHLLHRKEGAGPSSINVAVAPAPIVAKPAFSPAAVETTAPSVITPAVNPFAVPS